MDNLVQTAGYGPPGGGGYGPPPGGFGGPPPGGGGGGYGPPPPPGGGGYGPPPGGFGGPPPGGFGGPPPGGGFGPPQGGFGPPGGGFGGPMAPMPTTSGLAIASLVCGIISIPGGCCCSFVSIPLAIAAVILGVIGMNKVNAEPNIYTGKGLAIGGIVTGGVAVIFGIIMLIVGMGSTLMDQYNN
jgi:hypothetical protein